MPENKSFMEQYGGKIIGGFVALLQLLVIGAFGMLYSKAEANETNDVNRHIQMIGLIGELESKVDGSIKDDTWHLKDFNELKAKVERKHP